MDLDGSVDDPFADFDVPESEKEFLLSILDAAPTEELEALNGTAISDSAVGVEFCITPAPRSAVEVFAHTHPYWSSHKLPSVVDDEMAEFKRDVYEFAQAAGMGKNQAKVEVMRAVAALKKESRLGRGELLVESDEESYAEPSCASPVLAWMSAVPLINSEAKSPETSNKRKHEAFGKDSAQGLSSQVVKIDAGDAKRVRRELKRQRRKEAREEKKLGLKEQEAVKGIGNQSLDQSPVMLLPQPTSKKGEPVQGPQTKRRKKSKLGPTSSTYFAKPQIPISKPKSKPPLTADNSSWTSHTSKRARKRQRGSFRLEDRLNSALSVAACLKAVDSIEQVEPVQNTAVPRLNKPMSAEQEAELAQTEFDHNHTVGEHRSEVTKRKRKRNKKRNQNRLPEGPRGPINAKDAEIASKQEEAVKLYAEKPSSTEAFVESTPHTFDDEEAPNQKRKRRRKRQLSRVDPVLDGSYHSLPVPDETELVPRDHNPDSSEKPFNSDIMQRLESFQVPRKKPQRDQERKPKDEHRARVSTIEAVDAIPPEYQAIVEPLTELANTNVDFPSQIRKERGRERNREQGGYCKVEADPQSSREHLKIQHS